MKKTQIGFYILALAQLVFVSSFASAASADAPKRDSRVTAANSFSLRIVSGAGNLDDRLDALDPIDLGFVSHREGSVRVRIDRLRKQTWKVTENGTVAVPRASDDAVLRGAAFHRGMSVPVSVTARRRGAGRTVRITFLGFPRTSRARRRLHVLDLDWGTDGATVSRAWSKPLLAMAKAGCAVEAHTVGVGFAPMRASVKQAEAVETRRVRLALDSDSEFAAIYGTGTSLEMASLADAAELLYLRDLGIQFDLTKLNVWTEPSPFSQSQASELLNQFQSYTNERKHLGNADGYHLLSGKDFVGSIAGIAYVGTMCSLPDFSFGVEQHVDHGTDFIILAHELGHTFGANHSLDGGVMSPVVGADNGWFSEQSRGEILDHLTSSGSCLSAGEPWTAPEATPLPKVTATPAPHARSSLFLFSGATRSRVVELSALLEGPGGTGLSGQPVTLMRSGETVRFGWTDFGGEVLFRVRPRGSYRVTYRDASTNLIASNVVRFPNRKAKLDPKSRRRSF